jgi:hypothetical protein
VNRRTVLQSAGVAAVASLAGCLDGVEEHFTGSLQQPVPIEITNDGERAHDVHLEARARDDDRQTYEQSYTVVPDERVGPPHLEGSDQQFRVRRFGDDDEEEIEDLVETATITDETQLVLISIYDDDLELEVVTDEEEAEERQEDDELDRDEGDESADDGDSS